MADYTYVKDQELSSLAVAWYDYAGNLLDVSTGYTFMVKIAARDTPTTTIITKSTNITGAATSPNLLINWDVNAFSTLTAAGAVYVLWIIATRTADGKHRVFSPENLPRFTLLTAPS